MKISSKVLLLALGLAKVVVAQPARFIPVDSILYRGAAPESKEEFIFLRDIGVKTIVSVDRAKPNFHLADSLGLKYIQIPIGYGSIPREKIMDFLKAMSMPSLTKPFYIHCHAGKYRNGALSAIYRITYSGWSIDSAYSEFIQLAGDDKYRGLNSSVKNFNKPSESEIQAWSYDPAKAIPSAPLAERMSDIDRLWDDLRKFKLDSIEQGGTTLALEEHFAEIARLKLCKNCKESDYKEMIQISLMFQEMRKMNSYPIEKIQTIKKSCSECHFRIRD